MPWNPQIPQTPPEMSPLASWSLPLTLLSLLCCQGSGEEAFKVNIWSEKQIVEATESLTVNCSTSCEDPQKGGLETTLTKKELNKHPQEKWIQFLVSNISRDTVLLCFFTCAGKLQEERLSIQVYQPPAQVTLKLQPPRVFVGETFTIECKVSPVKPLESLTLSLLRGRETLQNQTFGGAKTGPQEAVATFNSTALKKDSLNFSCQAELDLRPHGGYIIRSISEFQTLEVYGGKHLMPLLSAARLTVGCMSRASAGQPDGHHCHRGITTTVLICDIRPTLLYPRPALEQEADRHLRSASCLEEAAPSLPGTSCVS